ncbi:hypothetical protein UXN85_20910 [Enterobacter hormaechei]
MLKDENLKQNGLQNVRNTDKNDVPHLWGDVAFRIIPDLKLFKSFEKTLVTMYALEAAAASHCYTCTYAVKTLMTLTGASKSTINRTFDELEAMGLVLNQVRAGKGRNDTTARIFNPRFIEVLVQIQEGRKKLKPEDAASFAQKLFTEFVDNPVDMPPMEDSEGNPEQEGGGYQEETSIDNSGYLGEAQNTGTDPTDQTPKKQKNINSLVKFPAEFFHKIKNLTEFFRQGAESRKRHIQRLGQSRAYGRSRPKEDPAFPSSFAGKVYTVPAGFRS